MASLVAMCVGAGISMVSAEPDLLPAPPLVAQAPAVSRWTITVQQKIPPPPQSTDPLKARSEANAAMQNPRMQHEDVEKAGEILHQETDWENGAKDELWFIHDFILQHPRNTPADRVYGAWATDKFAPRRPKDDFPELDWIDAKAYSGRTTYNGTACYLYKIADPNGNTTSAWIDFKTRLPVAVDTSTTLSIYTFSAGDASIAPQGIFVERYKLMLKEKEMHDHPTIPL